jgi:uncharacterized protein YdbL (DUF1318 family)
MNIRRIRFLPAAAVLLTVAACVTVNIYFPAAKVERTADEIVSEVYGEDAKKDKKAPDAEPKKKPDGSSALTTMLAWLAPSTAHAADATTVSNSSIRALKQRIKARHAQLTTYYKAGQVCIAGNGYLSLGNTRGLPMAKLAALKRLVSADNADRKRLYQEVTKALKLPAGEAAKVQNIFASYWRSKAPGSWSCR